MAFTSTTGTITTNSSIISLGLSGDNQQGLLAFYGTYSGISFVVEGSNDGSNWTGVPVMQASNSLPYNGTAITLASNASQAFYFYPGQLQRIRVRSTAYGSGTANVIIAESNGALPQVVPAIYALDANNVARNTVALAAGGGTSDVVMVNSGPGILHRLIVTTAGTAALSIYDSATVSSGKPLLYTSATAPALGTVIELDFPFSVGLVAAVVSGSAALTVGYTLY